MRLRDLLLCGVAVSAASPASAADALKYGKAPDWVVSQAIPAAKATEAPVAVLLNDEQIAFEAGKVITYSEGALKIQNAQGLAAGNLALVWQPATDTVTVNKLLIRRGDKVIDVLANGQTFTVLRRETNLDAATLDGTLTATIQPEGLQEGDIIELATTIERSDPVLKGHVEATFAQWNGIPIETALARVIWAEPLKVTVRETPGLPAFRRASAKGKTSVEITAQNVDPLILPKDAPNRFQIGRLGEASDFASWSEVSDLMLPLFQEAAVISASSPLQQEVERIRAAASDPKARAQLALTLVQDRVRYVALLMGQGGYVPTTAETTWSRRFGDCKAKTALLLALLKSLGIEAEPVLVNSKFGDAVADRLPMLSWFDHVLVRARIGGKEYWLDGTRTGDTSLDAIPTPEFGWSLPLKKNAELVRVVPPPRPIPDSETSIRIDASSGAYASAKVTVELLFRGDGAVALNSLYSRLTGDQQKQLVTEGVKKFFDSITVSSTNLKFDKAARELRVSTEGNATLKWKDSWYSVPNTSLAFDPDFDRALGPWHDAPVSIGYPNFDKRVISIQLPEALATVQKLPSDVNVTLAGVEYRRTTTRKGDVITIETSDRSLVPEVAYKDALASAAAVKKLWDDDVYLQVDGAYQATDKDLAAKGSEIPASQEEFVKRGLMFLNHGKYDEAISDFTVANKADPKSIWPLANRALAYIYKDDLDSAERDLKAAAAMNPNNAVVLRARALMAEQKDDCAAAIDYYTKSLVIDRGNNFAIGHRAQCAHALGKEDEALADSEKALKVDPTWMDLRIMRSNIFHFQGKRDAVAREAELLVEQNPNSSYAFVAAGRIYARVDRREDAFKSFDRALAIKPESYVYLNRAQSRPFTDYAGRLADLDAALKLDPDDPDTLAEMAEQLAATGDLKGARQIYNQIKPAADKPYLQVRRAIILYKTGSTTEAEKILADRRIQAKTPLALNSLCWAKATAGILLESAAQDCLEALKMKPDQGQVIDSLAFVRLRMGKLDEAITLYTKAIEQRMGSASYMGRAIAYARKGDMLHAQADRAEALRLDGDAETRFTEFGLKFDDPSARESATAH